MGYFVVGDVDSEKILAGSPVVDNDNRLVAMYIAKNEPEVVLLCVSMLQMQAAVHTFSVPFVFFSCTTFIFIQVLNEGNLSQCPAFQINAMFSLVAPFSLAVAPASLPLTCPSLTSSALLSLSSALPVVSVVVVAAAPHATLLYLSCTGRQTSGVGMLSC